MKYKEWLHDNQEVFDAVREIQIKHRLRATPRYTREDASEFVDFMCELEAKKVWVRLLCGTRRNGLVPTIVPTKR